MSCSTELDENKSVSNENSFENQSISKTYEPSGFYVSESLLKNYLRFFCKNKTVEKIKPITTNNEILAYYVQYVNNGWDLISADKRLSPILVSSDKGILPDNYEGISCISPVFGMLQSVIDVRKSKCVEENGIWNFLSPGSKYEKNAPIELRNKIFTKSRNGLRGLGEGMWIAIDTLVTDTTISAPRLVNTNWAQDSTSYYSFFNKYTPVINNIHCPTGCGPVAVGQLFYKFFKDNPGQFLIPSTASVSGISVSFGSISTEAWGHLHNGYNDTTAVFLSWLGNRMNSEYNLNKTNTKWDSLKNTLGNYLNYTNGFQVNNSSSSELKNNFCDIILSSIDYGSPIFVGGQDISNDKHVFLIDYYQRRIISYIIRYQFDPYHVITDDEYYSYPSWRFDWPNNYDPEKDVAEFDEIINLADNVSIKMNWGWLTVTNGIYTLDYPNDLSFTLRTNTLYLGENGSYITNNNINLYWAVGDSHSFNGVLSFLHHFNRK